MAPITREWFAVILFVVCFVGLTFGEAAWLGRKKWAPFGRSLAFSLATNLFGFCIGLFISFVILGVILAMTSDGSIDHVPARDGTLWTAMLAAVFITPVLLVLAKRLLLWLLKMRTGLAAWMFSFAASVLIFIATLGLPVVILYLV